MATEHVDVDEAEGLGVECVRHVTKLGKDTTIPMVHPEITPHLSFKPAKRS